MSPQLLELHYAKHHQAYVNNLNVLSEKLHDVTDETAKVALMGPYAFNAGGHINHSIFWSNLMPLAKGGGDVAKGKAVVQEIEKEFGSFEAFVERFNAMTVGVQGSGWGWLGYNKVHKRLEMTTTANQELLLATKGLVPLLAVDVWEHAYYVDYKNVRADFLKNIWKVVNWSNVAERYRLAQE
jgi:Fe-Mn family superoxide dismutase